jgi:transcriptional regulator NrdR family protein
MWCASCRGTYLGLRRLVPELTVVDSRRARRPAKFDSEKLRRSFAEPIRKVPATGYREPYNEQPIPNDLVPLASEYLFDFVVEELARSVNEPNGEITTDFVAAVVLRGLHRMNVIAFLRSAVHHRLMTLTALDSEIGDLADRADILVGLAHEHTQGAEFSWPALREPPAAIACPRCGTTRIARRSRAGSDRGLDQQPASCSFCGQRYILQWGSQAPLLVSSPQGDSLFDITRFRAGIRSAVRKLPGTAAIWSDEKLVVSAANTAAVAAIPFIQPPSPERPMPLIHSGDLWLAAAAALRGIHPLAFVRYAVHSGAIDDLDWRQPEAREALHRMERTVISIAQRYFHMPAFPA